MTAAADAAERLAHRDEIRDLLARVMQAQDAHDWDALAACYEPDAVYTHPKGRIEGVDAVVERTQRALVPLDASQHLLGSVVVTVHHDASATAVSYFQAQHVRSAAAQGSLYTIAGTYRDRLTRRSGRWRIAERTQEYTWRDGNPDVIVR